MAFSKPLEIVIPYGKANAALHIRFAGDYVTFCGRNCEAWTLADTTFAQAVGSAYTCRKCLAASVK